VQTLSAPVDKLALAALGKGWADHGRLLAHWSAIAGEEFARHTTPVKLTFPHGGGQDGRTGGTLLIAVPQALALELQHESATLLARINGFFGYRAVARLAFTPKAVAGIADRPVLRPLSAGEQDAIALSVASIADSPVREALTSFGASLMARR